MPVTDQNAACPVKKISNNCKKSSPAVNYNRALLDSWREEIIFSGTLLLLPILLFCPHLVMRRQQD